MHAKAYGFVQRVAQGMNTFGLAVLEIGSLNVNGSVRPLFQYAGYYVGIDLRLGPGVDAVTDVRDFTSPYAFDVVVCCEVLEHDPRPREIVEAAERLLKRGGTLILTTAGPARAPHGCDGGPLPIGEPYANIRPPQLAVWLANWREMRLVRSADDADLYATAVRI